MEGGGWRVEGAWQLDRWLHLSLSLSLSEASLWHTCVRKWQCGGVMPKALPYVNFLVLQLHPHKAGVYSTRTALALGGSATHRHGASGN